MELIQENKMIKDKKNILSVYFTAGYPNLDDTTTIIKTLQENGVGLIEVGMPYSDPMADGETIQQSSAKALKNGMTLDILFEQLKSIKDEVEVPLIFMGYLNQWMQYGMDKFCKRAKEVGISGLIIPDLPLDLYEDQYKSTMDKYDLKMSFLVTPNTSDERIKKASQLSTAFLYVVSQSSITGGSNDFSNEQIQYFNRVKEVTSSGSRMIGFGINSASSFNTACQYANGAIIGSGFIRALKKDNLQDSMEQYIQSILEKRTNN